MIDKHINKERCKTFATYKEFCEYSNQFNYNGSEYDRNYKDEGHRLLDEDFYYEEKTGLWYFDTIV